MTVRGVMKHACPVLPFVLASLSSAAVMLCTISLSERRHCMSRVVAMLTDSMAERLRPRRGMSRLGSALGHAFCVPFLGANATGSLAMIRAVLSSGRRGASVALCRLVT